jgi:DMSO/TMAO reductase YedYZ molybdopterin-dependent catalytic subunit
MRRMTAPPPTEITVPGTVRHIPLAPEGLTAALTPLPDLFMLAHLGVRRAMAPADWTLAIAGLVDRPLQLSLADLAALPQTTLTSVHQCAGNPLAPTVPTRRVGCVTWGGVRLADVLALAGPTADARFLWADGADGGVFDGTEVPFYRKDLPLPRVPADVLLATQINGEPLPAQHGAPLRLVVPGWFGTNSVKWLWRLTLAERRAEGLFTTRLYNDPLPDGGTAPVWALLPEAVFVTPSPGATLRGPVVASGRAWSEAPITGVTVGLAGTDPGQWQQARIGPRSERGWQDWVVQLPSPGPGAWEFACRATDALGRVQPMDGARNAAHRITLHLTR